MAKATSYRHVFTLYGEIYSHPKTGLARHPIQGMFNILAWENDSLKIRPVSLLLNAIESQEESSFRIAYIRYESKCHITRERNTPAVRVAPLRAAAT